MRSEDDACGVRAQRHRAGRPAAARSRRRLRCSPRPRLPAPRGAAQLENTSTSTSTSSATASATISRDTPPASTDRPPRSRRRRPSPGQPDAPAHSLPAVSHRSVPMHRALVHSHPTRPSAGRPRPRHPPACNFQHRPAPLLKSHAARRLLVRRQHRSPPRHHHHHHHPGRRGAALASLVRTHARRPGLALSAHGSRASAALPSPQQPRA